MKLWGIAIYSNNLQKVKSAPDTKSTYFFANNDVFKALEENTLLEIIAQKSEKIEHRKSDDEHHYVKKILGKDFFIAIVSQQEIKPLQELRNLLNNIENAFLRPEATRLSLQEILMNPINYIGKSCLLNAVEQKTSEVAEIARKNITLVTKNIETLERMEENAIRLEEAAKQFNKQAEQVNSCCHGVRRIF